MLTKDFYNILDTELSDIIKKYPDDEMIRKHHNAEDNQKSYALLIWFLEFYGKKTDYVPYITDGPLNSSCDIIFDAKDSRNQTIYYVIQSKWNTPKNVAKNIGSTEIGYALSDFTTIWRGQKKPTKNNEFNQKLAELLKHIKSNGFVKFIFLALCQESSHDNVDSFNQEFKPHELKFIDINRIKHDYIERKYKQIKPANPLEHTYRPEELLIELEVIRRENNGDFVKIDKPFDAYIFLVKPALIFNLFEEFSFNLFFKNVRNPIVNSTINQQIETTLIENPAYFWYYNNGITAIVDSLPEISKLANKFEVYGFQIINGAQTVYAIHSAYKKASGRERAMMDREISITLRLLKSGGKDFNLQVTRYTNSQNPISDRDFHANDEVQIRLQKESFQTKFWYEKRQDEFRGNVPEGIKVLSNEQFAQAYLVYELQDSMSHIASIIHHSSHLNFVSNKEHPNGWYERIFNENTRFEDMLCSLYLMDLIEEFIKNQGDTLGFSYESIYYAGFFKIVFSKYLEKKSASAIPINQKIIELINKKDSSLVTKALSFIRALTKELLEKITPTHTDSYGRLSYVKSQYEDLKKEFDKMEIEVEEIDNITK
jgi:hypothetical protein